MRKLTAFELLVMHLVNNKVKGNVLNQSFWTNVYSTDPIRILNKLVDENILNETIDAELSLNKLTIPELKELLRSNNLKIGGNKKELINRLLENRIDITNVDLPIVYTVNGDYQKIFDETIFLTDFIYGDGATLQEAYQYYLSHPHMKELEIKTGVLIEKLQQKIDSTDPNSIYEERHFYHRISRMFFEYKKFEEGFYYLNSAMLIDIILSIRNYITYSQYGESEPRVHISNNDLVKYRSALINQQFTLPQLENDLINVAKHLKYQDDIKNAAIKYFLSRIQEDSVDLKPFVKNIKKQNYERNNTHQLKIEVEYNPEDYTPDTTTSPEAESPKKKKRFWLF